MNKKTRLRLRNPLHNHPLLKKGGVHKKSTKAIRQADKVKIKKEWLPQSIFTQIFFGESNLHTFQYFTIASNIRLG